jgi:hypothetical protein
MALEPAQASGGQKPAVQRPLKGNPLPKDDSGRARFYAAARKPTTLSNEAKFNRPSAKALQG